MQESTPDSLTEKIPTFQKLRTMKQLFFHLVPVLAFGLVLAACDNDSDEWTQPYEFAWSYGAESQFSVGKPATFTDLSLGVETASGVSKTQHLRPPRIPNRASYSIRKA